MINNFLSPILAKSLSVSAAIWFGVVLCGGGVACTCLLFPLERAVDRSIAATSRSAINADEGAAQATSSTAVPGAA